jgi:F-type H+-transporting ATPase subunit delta
VRAGVTLARNPDEKLKRAIQEALGRQLGKQVIPAFSVEPEILGGAIVRVGERVLDGSVRRRMTKLRRQMLAH